MEEISQSMVMATLLKSDYHIHLGMEALILPFRGIVELTNRRKPPRVIVVEQSCQNLQYAWLRMVHAGCKTCSRSSRMRNIQLRTE
jgi:hypothetical protein